MADREGLNHLGSGCVNFCANFAHASCSFLTLSSRILHT
jgi:hypothetical protein